MENSIGLTNGNMHSQHTSQQNKPSVKINTDNQLQSEHATHCDKCINLNKCKKEKNLRKSRPGESSSCPIITCRFNCGHEFHGCKSDEHDMLCSKAKVNCINKEYGCPFILERAQRASHLETCPASVVVCTMEWNRWPLPPGKCQPFKMDENKLDVAANLRDKRTILEWKESVPPSLRYLLKTYVNEKRPVMPLGVSGLRIPKSILSQAQIEHELVGGGVDISESTESEYDESSDSPWGWKKSPPGLQESVCNKLKNLKLSQENRQPESDEIIENGNEAQSDDDNHNETDEDFYSCASSIPENIQEQSKDSTGCEQNDPIFHNNNKLLEEDDGLKINTESNENHETNGATSNKKKVELSLIVEVRTKCQRKPDSMYTFMCSREFRRDEFPEHFNHIHSGIHTQLNGWLLQRCPMANLGCSFAINRMYPIDSNYKVVYNQVADAFCFTQEMDNQDEIMKNQNDKTENDHTTTLSSLPIEVLIHLTKYLDPLSLNCLSMTNRIFREICSSVIVDRGVVVLQWEKKKDGKGWEITEKKWLFSTYFSPIRNWKFGNLGRLSNHLLTCPYFERNLPSKPFSYASVTPDQL